MAEKVRCVIICGAPCGDAQFISDTVRGDDFVICADRGFEYANQAGVKVDLLIGDFDSYEGALPENIEVIKLRVHKDDSDSMHCASVAVEKGFREVVLLSAAGGRTDHTFSNLCVLSYLYSRGVYAEIKSPAETIIFLGRGEHRFQNLSGKTFSVFPFGCEKIVVSYIGGVEYPAEKLELHSANPVGLSNIFKSGDVSIIVSEGGGLLFIETLL